MLNQTLELLDDKFKSSLCFKVLNDLGIVFPVIILTCLVYLNRLLEAHPCIAAAVVHLSRIVIPKADKDSSIYTSPPPRNNRYVLDAMSDDDEDEPPAAPTHTVFIGHVLSRGI